MSDQPPPPAVSGIVLAGGTSSRLGQNKALIDVAGKRMIERVIDRLRLVVDEIVLVANDPAPLAFLELPVVGDRYEGVGTLGGLHAGLCAIRAEYGLAVGCDMPFLNPELLAYMISLRHGIDVVMPRVGTYYEPLHALYAKRCLASVERVILSGQRRIRHVWEGQKVRYVDDAEIARHDPDHLSFFNVNGPQDLVRLNALLAPEADRM
jgi:molybdopterin-guanine dinucleotide biosynthesis protein A